MIHDAFDNTNGDSKSLGQLFSCHNPGNVSGPNQSDCFPHGFAITPSRFYCSSHPAFLHHVLSVLFCRAKEKVIGVGTFWIIALMKYEKSIWNRAFMNHPRCALGSYFSDIPVPPITSSRLYSSPSPALSKLWSMCWDWSVFVHLLPEVLRKSVGKPLRSQIFESNLDLHQSVWLIVCHALGSLKRKGISFSTL